MCYILRTAVAVLTLSLLAACGRAPLAVQRPAAEIAPQAETIQETTLGTLAKHAGVASWEGKLVRVAASFERYAYAQEYGRSYQGYKLWDHDGNWVLCQNIYTASSLYPGAQGDASRDLADGPAARLLAYGTFVQLEGKFHVARSGASHGAIFQVPASLDVYAVEGVATRELVNH
ncbi:MAG: hypothetical protein JWM80_3811 [Cyanobacteria bacterium RYN_339]|nr:hypothetical protein [Cyanobacteria bacterium RYN_339]